MLGKYSKNIIFLIIFFIVFAILAIWQPETFLSVGNFQSMAFQIPEFGLLALAMTLAMLAGGIDLSIISITVLSGIAASFVFEGLLVTNINIYIIISLAIFTAIFVGVLCGLLNGMLIGPGKLVPILVTLGSSRLFVGIAMVFTKGGAKTNFPEVFINFGNGALLFMPNIFIIFLVLALILGIILNRTKLGFKIYMIGTNPLAATFTGISNKRVLLSVYAIIGAICGCTALVVMARNNSIKVGYGTSYLLQSILVAVLGGIDPTGGFGTITGVVLGIFILQIISSGFNLIGFSAFLRNAIWGTLLIVVMIVNFYMKKNRRISND